MTLAAPPSGPPINSVDDAIERMTAISKALAPDDGLASFNNMYLDVTTQVQERLGQQFFADPAFMTRLDVVFANLYLDAVNAVALGTRVPLAWQPLMDRRGAVDVEPIQFAFAGMNAHIAHDLPLAVVATCAELGTTPQAGSHHDDYEKVDVLLDAIEQSVRESFEAGVVLEADEHCRLVVGLLANLNLAAARDVAWSEAIALWDVHGFERDAVIDVIAGTVSATCRGLLVSV